jgi:predicted phage terminase large subunit-like protein
MPSKKAIDDPVGFRRSIQEFASVLSPIVGDPWLAWPYLTYICEAIVKEIKRPGGGRIIINMPPRHGKSMVTAQWLPAWFLECFPEARVILTSYESTKASDWGRIVRDIFNLQELRTKVRPDKSAIDNWETLRGGGMRTAGSGAAITGSGANLIIIDDPIKDWQEAHSPTMRKHLIDWFLSTLYTRKEPNATIVINHTRWHEGDLTGYLLSEHSDDWTHVCLPAMAEENDVLGREIGEALCQARYPIEELEKIKKAVGSFVWSGLFQQGPKPAEGNIIKIKWLKYYDILPFGVMPVGISVDATFKETKAGSFVAIQAWGKKNADFYLLDQIRDRMDFVATTEALKLMCAKYPQARAKWIEDKANGPAIISILKKKIPGLIEVNPAGGKEARLQAVSPIFEAGNVHLPLKAEWIGEYVQEVTTFPNAKDDDQVDCTSQALFKMTDGSKGSAFLANAHVSVGGLNIPLF